MRTQIAAAMALPMLGLALAGDYVPLHKRYSYSDNLNDFSYLGMLSRRDTCSQVIPGSRNSNCAPSQTLCCTVSGKAFPSCQQYLHKGWCCVASDDDDNCYADLRSNCDAQGAVHCNNLAEGTQQACCPSYTTCDDSLAASENLVRCSVKQGDLKARNSASLAKTASTSTSTTMSSSTSSSSAASTTTAQSSQTSDVDREGAVTEHSAISGGAIGGIVAGVVVAIVLAGLGIFFYRRHRKRNSVKYQAASQGSGDHDHTAEVAGFVAGQDAKRGHGGVSELGSQHPSDVHPHPKYGYSGYALNDTPSELPASDNPVEAPGDHSYRT